MVVPVVPVVVAVIGRLAAGRGMGLTYPTLSVLVLELSPPTEQGADSSALQIDEALFRAVALAASGALFAALFGAGQVAYAVGFALAVVPAAPAVSIAGRGRDAEPGVASVDTGSLTAAHTR